LTKADDGFTLTAAVVTDRVSGDAMDTMDAALVILRTLLGLLFLVSGVAKWRRGPEFAEAVKAYRLVPPAAVPIIARALPLTETILAVLLLAGVLEAGAGIAATGLLLLLGAAMGINLVRGRRHDCGCLGIAEDETISWALVARNAALAVVAMTVTVIALSESAADWQLSAGDEWLLALYIALAALAATTGRVMFRTIRPAALGGAL
jgi:uncharacterized membrane protein YphA (DoxX/SURF4 family)